MTSPRHLTRTDARRIAVHAQLLTDDRPDDLHEVVRRLTLLQADPTAAVAPSADVVLWSRLGATYDPRELESAVADGFLIELNQRLRPAEDLALHRAEMAAWPGVGELTPWQHDLRDWVAANDDARRDVLEKLYDEGPLPLTELPDTTVLPWRSSGWTNDRSLRRLLDLMVARGEVAGAGREGRVRLWDLAERVYPDVPVVPLDEALRIRQERELRALGIVRVRAPRIPHEHADVGGAGEPAVVEGVRGAWRVDPAYVDLPHAPRTALLSPLDRLVFDRRRMAELFEFDYQLEMYKPVAARRWGYWALPVLSGDRLVGKIDASADREAGELRVDAVHQDHPWDDALVASVHAEVEDLAGWLGLVLTWPQT